MPEVTVLLAVHNGEKYLKQAVDSILEQTFADFEFLIVDDASSDRTPHILAGYQDPRLRIVRNETNLGLTASLNRGLKEARGTYIARMDADDISLNERLEKQLRCFVEQPGIGAAAGWAQKIDEHGKSLGRWDSPHDPEEIYYLLNFRNCLTHSTMMFKRDIVLDIGGYDERMRRAQDYELWYRLSKVTKIFQLKDVLVRWRQTGENISASAKNEQDETARNLAKKNLEALVDMSLTDGEIAALQFNLANEAADINRVCFLLDTINRALFSRESHVIERVGLARGAVKKSMRTRKKNLLVGHLRALSKKAAVQQFFSFSMSLKWFLLKASIQAFIKKPIK